MKLEIAAGTVELEIYGTDGPWVCMLPGLGGGIRRFAPLGGRLSAAGYRAVALNPRGAGASTGSLDGLSLRDLAEDVAAVIRALDCGRAHVIGNAFGSRVARCVAADHPDLVAALVLLGAGGAVPPEAGVAAAIGRFLDETAPASVRLLAAGSALFAPGNPVPSDFLRDGRSEAAARSQIAALGRTPVAHWWKGGECPTLLIQGLQDRVAPPENGYRLRAEVGPRIRLLDVERAGHAVLDEQPERVADAILEFLAGIS